MGTGAPNGPLRAYYLATWGARACSAVWRSKAPRLFQGLQITQSRSYLYTLGSEVGIIYILGAPRVCRTTVEQWPFLLCFMALGYYFTYFWDPGSRYMERFRVHIKLVLGPEGETWYTPTSRDGPRICTGLILGPFW